MRVPTITFCCLLLAGCGPRSRFHDYSTPERAAQSFVEAGRVGDTHSLRCSVVADERDGNLSCDYRDLGRYSLRLVRLIHDESAVVMLETGAVEAPIACVKEADGWKVSLRRTLARMQETARPPSPR